MAKKKTKKTKTKSSKKATKKKKIVKEKSKRGRPPKKEEDQPKPKIKKLSGCHDIFGEDNEYWHYFLKKIFGLVEDYGFERIRTPIVENKTLFSRCLDCNVVSVGKGKALRPDITLGIARSYLSQEIQETKKFYYLGPAFNFSNTKDLNEFYEVGLEVIGSDQPIIDAELISLAYNIFDSLKFDVCIQISNLGCRRGRRRYMKKLKAYFEPKKRWLCKKCKKDLATNPLNLFHCEHEDCQEIVKDAPQLVDNLCDDCKKHFIGVLEALDEIDVSYRVDPLLVEGANYNMQTVFEFCLNNDEGEKIVLGRGGRHNNLLEDLGSEEEVPATGWSINIGSLVKYAKKYHIRTYGPRSPKIFLAQVGQKAAQRALSLFKELREKGNLPAKNFAKRGLKEQLQEAKKIGVDLTLILGEKETKDETIIIRNMETGNQETVDQAKLMKELDKKL